MAAKKKKAKRKVAKKKVAKKRLVKKKVTKRTATKSKTTVRSTKQSSNKSVPMETRIEKYCQAIFKGASQSDAYREAYPGQLNSSDKTIHEKASRFNAEDKVQARYSELKREMRERNAGEIDQIVAGIARIANFDVRRLYDSKGELLPIHKLPDDIALAIDSIEYGESKGRSVIKRIRSANKLGAQKLLGDRHGLFKGNDVMLPAGMTPVATSDKPKVAMTMDVTDMSAKEASQKYRELSELIDVSSD